MNPAKEIRLRELASQYYHELISFEDYRQRRTHLLDRLEQTTEAPEDDEDTQPRFRFNDPSSNPDRGTKKNRGTVYTLILVVIIMGIAAMIWNLSIDGKRPATDVVPDTPVETPVENRGQTEGPESLVAQFLNANEWSVNSIAGFTKTWERYSHAERQTALTSHWFKTLQDRLTERLRMEESKSNRSAGGGISDEALLLKAFARNLGLSLQAGAPGKTSAEIP